MLHVELGRHSDSIAKDAAAFFRISRFALSLVTSLPYPPPIPFIHGAFDADSRPIQNCID